MHWCNFLCASHVSGCFGVSLIKQGRTQQPCFPWVCLLLLFCGYNPGIFCTLQTCCCYRGLQVGCLQEKANKAVTLKYLIRLGCQNQRLTVYTVTSFAYCTGQQCKQLYIQQCKQLYIQVENVLYCQDSIVLSGQYCTVRTV